jgi:hypothetical protein
MELKVISAVTALPLGRRLETEERGAGDYLKKMAQKSS